MKQAASLRILDPACGSGSFLIGAYQYLLDGHRDWYTKNDPEKWLCGKNPTIYKARAGEYRLTTPERKKIRKILYIGNWWFFIIYLSEVLVRGTTGVLLRKN